MARILRPNLKRETLRLKNARRAREQQREQPASSSEQRGPRRAAASRQAGRRSQPAATRRRGGWDQPSVVRGRLGVAQRRPRLRPGSHQLRSRTSRSRQSLLGECSSRPARTRGDLGHSHQATGCGGPGRSRSRAGQGGRTKSLFSPNGRDGGQRRRRRRHHRQV